MPDLTINSVANNAALATPKDANDFTQAAGLDGLLAQPTFTFNGSEGLA